MKTKTAIIIRIIGVFLTMLGAVIFCLLFVLWSAEEYSSYSVPIWPMVMGMGITFLGLICVKTGATSNYGPPVGNPGPKTSTHHRIKFLLF
ncbi:MAG: hypothetical protein HN416_13005 [Nitrospina sp.]|jgi:hypothetical protein|nr:hypothetical protein [Nitrospina sp.]